MLQQLYEQVKKFAQYLKEAPSVKFDASILQTVMFRTLALLADLYLMLHNYQQARQTVLDLQSL